MGRGGHIAMSIDLHRLVSWFSPAFPIGAFSYSHGLEAAIANGDVIDGTTLKTWLTHLLRHGSGWNDCLLIVAAYGAGDEAEIQELRDLANALAAGNERQLESSLQGDAFAKTVSAVSRDEFEGGPLPVVVGTVANAHGIPLADLLPVYLHAFCSNLISAAARSMALGQIEAQQILASLFLQIDEVATDALSASLEDIGGASFLADLASMQHETLQPRQFRT